MKSTSLILVFLLFSSAFAQESAPPGGFYKPCRGDEPDSSTCITPPHATYSPNPEYPAKEQNNHRGGTVTLQFVVGTDGLPQNISVSVSLSPAFDAAAVDALKKWKFSPATKNGKPVAVNIAVQMSFHPPPEK